MLPGRGEPEFITPLRAPVEGSDCLVQSPGWVQPLGVWDD